MVRRSIHRVGDDEGQFRQAVNENLDFAGSSIAVDLTGVGSGHYLLGDDDLRTQFFTDLGFTVPDASTGLSQERLDLLNADVLAVNGYNQEDADADTLFSSLDVVTQGRTVLLGSYSGDVSAALGFGSPLSLPYLLDEAVPALAAADGDPPPWSRPSAECPTRPRSPGRGRVPPRERCRSWTGRTKTSATT